MCVTQMQLLSLAWAYRRHCLFCFAVKAHSYHLYLRGRRSSNSRDIFNTSDSHPAMHALTTAKLMWMLANSVSAKNHDLCNFPVQVGNLPHEMHTRV